MADEEQATLLENPIKESFLKRSLNFVLGQFGFDCMRCKRILANVYYEWNNPMTYSILVCINAYIILSCLFYAIVPTPVYLLEILVMTAFTFELLAKAILIGPQTLWEKDGKIDSIAYVMCFISLFGPWDFTVPGDDIDYSQMGDKYAKIFVVSFRIIAQLTRIFRGVFCHYKAKFKCDDKLWLEMDENL